MQLNDKIVGELDEIGAKDQRTNKQQYLEHEV
jgi:hypothetical protein